MAVLATPEAATAERAPAVRLAPERQRPRRRKPKRPARDALAGLQARIDAADARQTEVSLEADVREFRDDFASANPRLHEAAARRLSRLSDAQLLVLQRKWRAMLGGDLYPFLFERSAHGSTPGVDEALLLLRRVFARHTPMHLEFWSAYVGQKLIDTYAWQLNARFAPNAFEPNAEDMLALAVLRDQPRAARIAIAATFRARYGKDLLDWLIGQVPRSEASVRAIAILREGDDRGPHVDLATILIPPQNTNRDLPIRHLRVPIDRRKKLEEAFDRVFAGVGPQPWANTPDTLRGHLEKLDSIVRSNAPYHEALMLLHHDLSDAEKLYLTLTRWRDTKNDSAIALAQDMVRRGVGRKRLEADWDRYVKGGEGGAPAGFFTKLALREHIRAMFRGTPTETEGHLTALLDQLDQEDDAKTVDAGVVAAPSEWNAQDEARQAAEDRRLRAAEAVIAAVQGRVAPNDKAIIEALGEIAGVLHARVARLEKRSAEARARRDLDPADRQALARYYDDEAEKARADGGKRRRRLTARLVADDDPIRISRSERDAARIVLAEAPTAADKVWLAAHDHDWDELVQLVTRTWAGGGMNDLLRDAAKPGEDALGLAVRPPFNMFELLSRMAGTLSYRRIIALSLANISDARRGVARIHEEMKEGRTGPDLAPIVDLLGHHELTPKLREEVLESFVAFEADDGVHKPKDETPARFFLSRMADHFEGKTANWARLRDLLDPAQTADERRERARDTRTNTHRGRLGWVAQGAARAWSEISGDYLFEAEARSEDRLQFIRSADDAQLASMMAAAGVKTREELSAQEYETFQQRHGDAQAMENAAATLIAGFVETLVEAGLAPLTGGSGLAAVIGAGVAAIASMVAQEAMLGPDYKLISGENLNTVLQSALGSAMVELDLRSTVLKALPLEGLAHQPRLQQMIQNQVTGALESSASALSEIATNVLVREKWPTDEDIARQADQMLGRMVAKAFSTQVTVSYHPGKYRSYMPFAERLKTNALFKLSLKVTEAGAKEIVSIVTTGARDQTFAEQVLQVLWKETRGVASTGIRSVASAAGGAGTAHGGKVLVDEMRQRDPTLFAPLIRSVLKDHYEADPALKAEHARQQASGRRISVDQFMLEKLRAEDKPGKATAAKLQSKVEKELLTYAQLLTGREKGTQGVLAFARPAAGIQAVAEAEAGPPRPDPALANRGVREGVQRVIAADRRYQARKDAEQAAAEETKRRAAAPLGERLADIKRQRERVASGAIAEGPTPAAHAALPLTRLRITALVKEHALLAPEHFATRAHLVAEVLEGETPLARGVLAGDRKSLDTFLHKHGDWGQAIQILQTLGAGQEAAGVGLLDWTGKLRAERDAVARHLRTAFGAAASEHASTEVTSDLDLAIKGENAAERRRMAEDYMARRSGPNWRTIWNISFFGEGSHLTRYADFAHLVPKEERSATQLRLTNLTEHYAFTRMLHLAQKSGRKDVEQFVEALAGSLGHDLTLARSDGDRLAPARANARRHTLEGEIEAESRQLDRDANDPNVSAQQRFQRAAHLAELTMEANFLTREANIGPGANRALLQGVEVKGPEAFQAFMNHALMYVEHKVEPGSHLTYVLPKYISRMVGTIESAGIADPALHVHGQVAAHAYRNDRLVNSKGGPRVGAQLPNTSQDIIAQAAGFEAAVLAAAARLKTDALGKLHVVAEQPAARRVATAKSPGIGQLQKPMRPQPAAKPPRPAEWLSDRSFFLYVRSALASGMGFSASLAARGFVLDAPTARGWIVYLSEQAAKNAGDQALRSRLAVMNDAFDRLSKEAPPR